MPTAAAPWRLQVFESLPSTSDLLRNLAAAGEPEGAAVLARRQERGRGSHGRAFSSPVGNMFLSVLLRPCGPVREGGLWSLLAGLVVAEAVAALLPDPAMLTLKWPNDVLLDRKKLAGILVDSAATDAGTLDWLVVGIGVNLAIAPAIPDRPTACLAEVIDPPPSDAMAESVLARLAHWRGIQTSQGWPPVRDAWRARAQPLGAALTLTAGARELHGRFAGLGDDGSLLLETDGKVEAFTAGEVRLRVGA